MVVFIAGVVALAAAVRIHRQRTRSTAIVHAPAQIRIGRKLPTSPDAPQPTQNGARPSQRASLAERRNPVQRQKSGVKKPGRKT